MILNLKDISSDCINLFGAKALVLGKLIQNNINVPEGYVLSNEEFSSYLKYNKFRYSKDEYLSHNDEIQDFISKGEFPPELKVQLNNIYNNLTDYGKSPIAIRSSTVFEDNKEHSMAGVFDSIINVVSYIELEYSIKKCYASLFSEKALVMMLQNNIKFEDIGMGVIAQKFIDGDISGVMFTADIIVMDESTIVINAVKGLCSGFVDSSKKSSCYRVKKSNGQIIDYSVSNDTPEIKDKELKMLVESAMEIEVLLGYFQDVEWTINNNKLYILQSRPITTFKVNDACISWTIPEEDENKTWLLSSPEPTTPLEEELLFIFNEGITKGMIESGKGGGLFTKVLNGYAYNYLAPRDNEIRKVFREKMDRMNANGKNIFEEIVLPQLHKYRNELSMLINENLQTKALIEIIIMALDFFQKAIYLHILAVDGSMYLDEFKKYCMDIIPDISENDFYDLVFQKSILAVERERVLEIAEFVKSHDILSKLFHEKTYNEILFANLKKNKPGLKLHQLINDYLKDYGLIELKGHRFITSEVLQEKPWELLDKIKACMDMNRDIYYESLNKILINKRKIHDRILERLDENEKENFMKKLRAAEKSFLVNDDHCFYIDLTSQGYLRLALMKAGKILMDRKVINQPEDIYFMKLDEIFTSLTDEYKDLDFKVKDRKELYDKNKKLIPPEFLGNALDKSIEVNKVDIQNDILKGESGLGRRVSGNIKVFTKSTKNHDIKDNCILVLQHGHGCYFLPIMNRIKGLIYDEGSPFDHPGILAREFEIPSIYKTGNATKILKDGDMVELDGINGEVRILRRAR